ncbi:hypothetical protein Cpir12675_006670 [Ceratocystis pirilliformis]|uniref:Calcipressin-like protein n=1 Tax=Ceratocystis pirilliformis TaxID=259994 RepID=A0ABR3YHC6_9PEZI
MISASTSSSLAGSKLSSRRGSSNLSIDISCIPTMAQPTPITNTLLITNLDDPAIFNPQNLMHIRSLIEKSAQINTWSPLRSFRRIVVSFKTTENAQKVRHLWDGESILGHRTRVFFGQETPVGQPRDEHLTLPDAGKLFFISPPPSPPMGWEMRLEDAPNKQVHADDLADALAKLNQSAPGPSDALLDSPISPVDISMENNAQNEAGVPRMRSRSSTLIWHPEQHGHSSDKMLPCIAVEDTTGEQDLDDFFKTKPILAHTMRPPVELINN